MPGHSSKTTPVAIRLKNYVLGIVERRAKKQGMKLSEYIKYKITYDALRKR